MAEAGLSRLFTALRDVRGGRILTRSARRRGTLPLVAAFTVCALGIAAVGTSQAAGKSALETKAAAKTASGIVKSSAPDSFVVVGRAGSRDTEWTFAIDPTTIITKGGKGATSGDLRTGDHVTVRYIEQDGRTLARSIAVTAKKAEARPSARK